MKRKAEFLIEKRDGRREWLRTTKLARSVHLALLAAGEPSWRALDLASAVINGLQVWRGSQNTPVRSAQIAEAVQRVLVATGSGRAAALYESVGFERRRRRATMAALGLEGPEFVPATLSPMAGPDRVPGPLAGPDGGAPDSEPNHDPRHVRLRP